MGLYKVAVTDEINNLMILMKVTGIYEIIENY